MLEAERYPIDYEAIRKGDVITKERLVEILGGDPASAHFHAMRAKLADEIQNRLWQFNTLWTVCIVKGEIVICTDADAVRYNERQFWRARRAMVGAHRLQSAVDVAQLDPEEQRAHHRAMGIQGAVLAAALAAQRQAIVQHRRQEPPQLEVAG